MCDTNFWTGSVGVRAFLWVLQIAVIPSLPPPHPSHPTPKVTFVYARS